MSYWGKCWVKRALKIAQNQDQNHVNWLKYFCADMAKYLHKLCTPFDVKFVQICWEKRRKTLLEKWEMLG